MVYRYHSFYRSLAIISSRSLKLWNKKWILKPQAYSVGNPGAGPCESMGKPWLFGWDTMLDDLMSDSPNAMFTILNIAVEIFWVGFLNHPPLW